MKHSPGLNTLLPLLAALAWLAGCTPIHPSDSAGQHPPRAAQEKSAAHISLADMEPGFLYLAAQNALKQGQTGLAADMLEALVEKDKAAIEPHLQLVQLLLQQQKFDKAATHIEQLAASDSLSAEQQQQLELMQARLAYGQGKSDTALKQLDAFLARHANNIHALELQVQILARQKRLPEAVRVIKKAIRLQDTPQLRLLQAQLLLQQGQNKAAKLALLQMQRLDPDNDTPVLMLSNLAKQQKNMDEAEALLRAFLKEHPDAMRVSNTLGRLLVQENRLVEAILIYRDLDQRTGGEPTVLQALGLLYYQHNDYKESAETFRKLIALQPSDEASFYLAASLEALKQYRQAREIYSGIDSKARMYNETQLRLAGLDAMQGQPEKAAKRLLRVIDRHPEQLMAYSMLSSIRIAQKAYRKVLDETRNTLAMRKLPPQILFNRAVAFDHFKQYDQVEAMLKRILEHDSRHSEALNFLAYTYAVQGTHLDEATTLVNRALAQKPDDGYYLDSLAWIQYKMGHFKQAVATQRKALAKVKDDPVMHEHMGDILWKNEQFDAARKQWQQAIRLKHENPAMLRKKIAKGLE
ncbi:MAG: tetratricopeptide repeat protein [Mariprofundaceae bacterium]